MNTNDDDATLREPNAARPARTSGILLVIVAGLCLGLVAWNPSVAPTEQEFKEARAAVFILCLPLVAAGLSLLIRGGDVEVRKLVGREVIAPDAAAVLVSILIRPYVEGELATAVAGTGVGFLVSIAWLGAVRAVLEWLSPLVTWGARQLFGKRSR